MYIMYSFVSWDEYEWGELYGFAFGCIVGGVFVANCFYGDGRYVFYVEIIYQKIIFIICLFL